MKVPIPLAMAAVSALGLSACGGGGEPSSDAAPHQETNLKVAYLGLTLDACLDIGIEKGYFEEEGLNIETSTIANPPAGVAAVQSGEIDLTSTPSIPMLNALAQGVPLTVVAALNGFAPGALKTEDPSKIDSTGLYVRADSDIDSPADLEGETVSVPARGAQMEVAVAAAIKEDGGDPNKVNWMVLDYASALESLTAERIAAASLVAPFTDVAESDGHEALVYPSLSFFGEGTMGLWVAGAETAETKSEALEGFQAAMHKTNEYCNNNLEEVYEKGAEMTQTPLEVVKQGAVPYWPTEVALEDIESVNTKLVELGYLPEPADLDNLLLNPESVSSAGT